MTSNSLLSIHLLSPLLFYKNPIDIQESSTQIDGTLCSTNSCKSCNQNLASNNPASQYQRQKLIQNTVRVQSSLYTMNLAGLSSYQSPLNQSQIVEQAGTPYIVPPKTYWNQMSDRAKPSIQVAKVASGSTYHSSSTRHSITRDRPGAMTPGGIGVDIKHNSYDRYLNKIKGKAPLRRGIIPPTYGSPIPFNRAYPIYGGKIVKTSIINGCNCVNNDNIIYESLSNAIQDQILSVHYTFHIGDMVLAKKYKTDTTLYKGEIIDISDGLYTVKFEDNMTVIYSYCELQIYKPNCKNTISLEEELNNFSNKINQNNL
jgi:hypothetical protein